MLRKLSSPASARWKEAPLAPSLQRMAEAFRVPLWIDRRVDPQAALTLTLSEGSFAEVLDRIARDHDLGAVALDPMIYLGPLDKAGTLNERIAASRKQNAPAMKRRGETSWPRLAKPREIAEELTRSVGLQLANPEAIPHDLWAAGATASMPASDRLTLLLFGFDLKWRIEPKDSKRILIQPIASREKPTPPPTLASLLKGNRQPIGPSRQVYTLRLVGQPLGAVLKQLGQQLGREVRYEQGATGEASVKVAVEQATLEELLTAIGAAAGVAIEDTGEVWLVTPQ